MKIYRGSNIDKYTKKQTKKCKNKKFIKCIRHHFCITPEFDVIRNEVPQNDVKKENFTNNVEGKMM